MIDIADLELLRTLKERVKLTNEDVHLIMRIRRDALLARTKIVVLQNEIKKCNETSNRLARLEK